MTLKVKARHQWTSAVGAGNTETCRRCPALRRMTLVGEGSRQYLFSGGIGQDFGRRRPACNAAAPRALVLGTRMLFGKAAR